MQASTSEAGDVIIVNTDAKKCNNKVNRGKENFVWTDTEVELLLSITQEYKTRKTLLGQLQKQVQRIKRNVCGKVDAY